MKKETVANALKGLAWEFGLVDPGEVEFREDIRKICEGNSCHRYATTWACPPGVGSVQECELRARSYDWMYVFSGRYTLTDSFDFEGMRKAMGAFKVTCRTLDKAIAASKGQYLILTNESCDVCEVCTYPDDPCRFEEDLQHSLEGYGILVYDLARKAGIAYNNGPGTVTYLGAVLFKEG